MTEVYLDSSALLRLFDTEHASSDALVDYLDLNDLWDGIVLSNLNELECERVAVREERAGADHRADGIRSSLRLVARAQRHRLSINDDIVERAMRIPRHIKSLDALHLGLAIDIDARVLITYDEQMIEVAEWLRRDPAWSRLVRFTVVSP